MYNKIRNYAFKILFIVVSSLVVSSASPASSQSIGASAASVGTSPVSNIPIGLSLNMGVIPMTGCQSPESDAQLDCYIHRLGVAPMVSSAAMVIGQAAVAYQMNNSTTVYTKPLYYTNYQVNGYLASASPNYTFMRFASHQPLSSQNGMTRTQYPASQYMYTAVEFLVFSQNIVSGLDFMTPLKAVKLSSSKPVSYGPVVAAVNQTLIDYLKADAGYMYSCSSGSFLGGAFPVVHAQDAGMTAFQNYLFDACSIYNGSVFLCNNFDVALESLRADPKATLGTNANNQAVQITAVSFSSQLIGTNITVNDYFNGLTNGIALYIPLHFADPGTTYTGSEIGIEAAPSMIMTSSANSSSKPVPLNAGIVKESSLAFSTAKDRLSNYALKNAYIPSSKVRHVLF